MGKKKEKSYSGPSACTYIPATLLDYIMSYLIFTGIIIHYNNGIYFYYITIFLRYY